MRPSFLKLGIVSAGLVFSMQAIAGPRSDAGKIEKDATTRQADEAAKKIGSGTNVRSDAAAAAAAASRAEERLKATTNRPKGGTAVSPLGAGNTSPTHATGAKPKAGTGEAAAIATPTKGPKTRAAVAVDENTQNIAKHFSKGDPNAEGVKALGEDVVKSAEATDGINRDATAEKLAQSFNRDTFEKADGQKVAAFYKTVSPELDAILKKLSPAQKKSLEVAINIYLMEALQAKDGKSPEAVAEAAKQLKDLLGAFKKDLSNPATSKEAMDFILGTIAYYGSDSEGKAQLNVALDLWNGLKDPTARQGMAEMMGAMANLHSKFVADQVDKGISPKSIDFEGAWLHVNKNIQDWVAYRLASNGVAAKDIPTMVKDMICGPCMGHRMKKCAA